MNEDLTYSNDEFKSSLAIVNNSVGKRDNFVEYGDTFKINNTRAYTYSEEETLNLESFWTTVDRFPSDAVCKLERCLQVCKVIYREVREFLAQCMDYNCFCFKKDPPFSMGLRDFLKKNSLFGIRQLYN